MNKAVLLQLQQAKAEASRNLELSENAKRVYDNVGYEDNETQHSPESITDTRRTSEAMEKERVEKEERIDRL